MARPSLVATLGQESQFFIGKTINVGVSGINLGSVQPIDIGTSVSVTPIEINRERALFRIDTNRSFLIDEDPGTFEEALSAFKQTVGATVEVEFGHTLVLSGLYEQVDFGQGSKVPGVGDVPGFNLIFNDRTRTNKKDAAIVLVTPYLPGAIETGPVAFRSEALERVRALWHQTIDPDSRMESIIDTITGQFAMSFHPESGDLEAPAMSDPDTVQLIINDTVARL
jgi:Flp pilus assembly secretin CpaC